jgi:hypothetical protein
MNIRLRINYHIQAKYILLIEFKKSNLKKINKIFPLFYLIYIILIY